jgi:Integrase zinc binding domain
LFVRAIEIAALEQQIYALQRKEGRKMEQWKRKHTLYQDDREAWWRAGALVVPEGTTLRKTLLQEYHEVPTAGHPGVWKTYQAIRRDYWWPTMHKDTEEYIKGCATCHELKS